MRRAACLVVLAALAGCGGGADRESSPVDDTACALADGIFPGEELSDWKGFADHVALVSVTDRRRGDGDLPFPVFTLDVEETYWSADRAPALPATVEVTTFPYISEGGTYVAPLIRFDRDDVWVLQSCGAPLPVERGEIVGEADPGPGFQPLRNRLAGRPAASLGELMDEAEVPGAVERHLHLRPQRRAREVYGQ